MPKASDRNLAPCDLQLTVRSVRTLLIMQITHANLSGFLLPTTLFAANYNFRSYPILVHQLRKNLIGFSGKAMLCKDMKEVTREWDPSQAGSQFAVQHSICFAMAILALSPLVCRFLKDAKSGACLSAWVQPYSVYFLHRLHCHLPIAAQTGGSFSCRMCSFCLSISLLIYLTNTEVKW